MKKLLFAIILLVVIGTAATYAIEDASSLSVPAPPALVPPADQPGDERIITASDHVTYGELRRAIWANAMLGLYSTYATTVYNVAIGQAEQAKRLVTMNMDLSTRLAAAERSADTRGKVALGAGATALLFIILFAIK